MASLATFGAGFLMRPLGAIPLPSFPAMPCSASSRRSWFPLVFIIRRSLTETEDFLSRKQHPRPVEIVRSVLVNWRVVLAGVMLVAMTTVSFYTITAYTPTFGQQVLKMAPGDSYLVTLCVGLTNLVWLPLSGALSDRLGRTPILLACSGLALVTAYPSSGASHFDCNLADPNDSQPRDAGRVAGAGRFVWPRRNNRNNEKAERRIARCAERPKLRLTCVVHDPDEGGRMSRFFKIILLSTCLLAPAVVRADEPMRHEWSDHENDAWHRYQKEKHLKAHEWTKASKREKARYWKWRDAHRD